MTPDEIKIISEKIARGEASPEEKLAALKELNQLVNDLRIDLAETTLN